MTDEKTHDSTLFKTGSWLQGRLVLFDRAYFKYRRFALIDENDGYFVSRLKENANLLITAELREWRGRAIPLEERDSMRIPLKSLECEVRYGVTKVDL